MCYHYQQWLKSQKASMLFEAMNMEKNYLSISQVPS